MNPIRLAAATVMFAFTPGISLLWQSQAAARLVEAKAAATEAPAVATANSADVGYCTPQLKQILRRVLQSCGLAAGASGRGCQPLEAKSVAALSGPDFNALFSPLTQRAGILQFDKDSSELDPADTELLDRLFADQGGASWFFVVSRASPEGSETHNRELSQHRGESVLNHLQQKFQDPDLDKEVGLLWLGEEFAQLDDQFCGWQRSGSAECSSAELNRSAFVAWIDCRL